MSHGYAGRFGKGCKRETPYLRRTFYRPLSMNRGNLFVPISANIDQFRQAGILDQGPTGSCNGHRTAMALHMAANAIGKPLPWFPSPDGLYRDARCLDRQWAANMSLPGLQDGGSTTADILRVLATTGARGMGPNVPGRHSDCDPSTVNREPTATELETEGLQLIDTSKCYSLTEDNATAFATDVSRCLRSNMPVLLDLFVGEDFEGWNPRSGPINAVNLADPIGGGHAILCTGIEVSSAGNVVMRGPNSWSEGWGEQGYWSMTLDCLFASLWGASSFIISL